MKLYDLSINEFLSRVDSATPTPGGGSVSALVISQGISLVRMVGHLTIGKKKFIELTENIKLDYVSRISSLEEIKLEMIEIIERDTDSFNKIMEAYKFPKSTDEEKNIRKNMVNKATVHATEVPLATAKLALTALELAEPTYVYANKTATSDFGVGINLIYAGLVGAVMNVKTNMNGYHDVDLRHKYYTEVSEIEDKALKLVERLNNLINLEFLEK